VVSLPETDWKLKATLAQLDRILLSKATEWARQMYQKILRQVDEELARHRAPGLEIEHLREVWYQTCLGPVQVKRRQYWDGKEHRYLLDELMGMRKRSHITDGVQELALELASAMPYRRSVEVLKKTTAIDLTHQTCWRLVGRAADPYLKRAEQELEWFQETGEVPSGEGKRVARLMVEVDGVMLSLQREREKKAEVKVGIAYESWERVSKGRYRTVNKTVFAGVSGGDKFWAGMSLKLQKQYDLSGVVETIVGGDGAEWIKEGARYVGGRFQLDRYHLNRELTAALGQDKATRSKVWKACQCGDTETALKVMSEALRQASGEQAQRVAKAYHYLRDNVTGIKDYRLALGEEGKSLRRSGAMEGNIDKLVARRMKNQGMSWSIKGIRRLLCVRFLVFEGKLKEWLVEKQYPRQTNIPKKRIRRLVTNLSSREPDVWLDAGLPALYGPHASHPWVKMLRAITESPTI